VERKAISSDQQVAGLAAAIGENRGDGVGVLLHAHQVASEMVRPRGNRGAQDLMQAVPGRHDLLEGQAVDHAALLVQCDAIRELHAQVGEVGARQAQALQQVVVGDDAGAAPEEFGLVALEQVGSPADATKQGRGKEASHGPADHNRAAGPGSGRGVGHGSLLQWIRAAPDRSP
jgi:hypothetical protein